MKTVFLKLGGSLITDKRRPETARLDILKRLAQELATVRRTHPALRLVIGHGSGSFGHYVGKQYGTRHGVQSAEQWYGFAATADAAARLNRIVTAELLAAGLPAWSIQPSVALRCVDGKVIEGPLATVQQALDNGLTPIVFGDVALDAVRGGTIASTEEIFAWLAAHLQPQRLVLAGEVDGVYTADPTQEPTAQRIEWITPQTFAQVQKGVGASHGFDVTGGMATKVAESLALVTAQPGLEILLCSGLVAGQVQTALIEVEPAIGTRILAG
jgi:isopentenyl phosphate kinase